MSEKRFLIDDDGIVTDMTDLSVYIDNEECCEKLNELTGHIQLLEHAINELGLSVDLVKDFADWDNKITNQDKISRRLIKIDIDYKNKSEKLLADARKLKEEKEIDIIKDKYGGNNDKTRRQYIKDELKDLLEEKQELTLQKEDNARRISFLKRLIDLKIELIKYGGNDELPETE